LEIKVLAGEFLEGGHNFEKSTLIKLVAKVDAHVQLLGCCDQGVDELQGCNLSLSVGPRAQNTHRKMNIISGLEQTNKRCEPIGSVATASQVPERLCKAGKKKLTS
jgi:hypothetical protein